MMDTIAIERGSLVEESGREGVVRGVGAAWSGASERSRMLLLVSLRASLGRSLPS